MHLPHIPILHWVRMDGWWWWSTWDGMDESQVSALKIDGRIFWNNHFYRIAHSFGVIDVVLSCLVSASQQANSRLCVTQGWGNICVWNMWTIVAGEWLWIVIWGLARAARWAAEFEEVSQLDASDMGSVKGKKKGYCFRKSIELWNFDGSSWVRDLI